MAQASISISQAYATLGLQNGADIEAVKKAYKEKALQIHPDKVPEERRAEATIEFQNIGAAYETITKHHQGPDDDDDDEFAFGPGHMPQFHFGFGGPGGPFFYTPFAGMFFEEIYFDLFDHMFGSASSRGRGRPGYGRGVPRNRRRHHETLEDIYNRFKRQEEVEQARLQRAEEERRAKAHRERERELREEAAAARKAKAEAKKQRLKDPAVAAAAAEARRVGAEKRAQEEERKAREALDRPQRIRSAVFEAVRKGNTNAVKKGVWEDAVDAAGPEILPRAVGLVKERPADWNKLETLLHIAVSRGDQELVAWLIKHNAEPEERDSWGQTPFNRAVHLGDIQIVRYFLSEFPPDSEDSEPVLAAPEEDTTLRLAVASTNPAVVMAILKAGLVNLSTVSAAWAWIDEQEGPGIKKRGGKYDKVRDVLSMIDGWTPPPSPEVTSEPMKEPGSSSSEGFKQQQRKNKNQKGGNQAKAQAPVLTDEESPAASSNKPANATPTTHPNSTSGSNSRGKGRGRGRGRGGRGRGGK
ncbi:hypothetical protein FS837_005170 [Tulasnella sp. UAMH 9824]|nr:hypothetical protein FS837_005170 [Tulasnella sp. UAMH 9824]